MSKRVLAVAMITSLLALLVTPASAAVAPIVPPTFEFSFGTGGTEVGQLHDPEGVAIAPDGSIWVGDQDRQRVLKFSSTGSFLFEIGPIDGFSMAVDHFGRLAVSDIEVIRVFDQAGTELFSFGGPALGSGPGQFGFGPTGIAVDSQGRFIVGDLGNARGQIFDQDGNFVTTFAQGSPPPGQIIGPHGVAVDSQDRIYLSWNGSVDRYDPSGAPQGTIVTGLLFPEGLATDLDDHLYIANTLSAEVIVTDSAGTKLVTLQPSVGDPFDLPHSIATDPVGRVVFTHGLNFEPVSVYRWQRCGAQLATQVGTAGNDVLGGSSIDDVIVALAGDDRIRSSSGNDVICGGDGNDLVFAGSGDDTVLSGSGNDAVDGSTGNDLLTGDDGNDLLWGGPGNDTLRGFGGTDVCSGGLGTDVAGSCELVIGVP
jgi:sugar lactone lactonase YvrE